MAGSETYKWQMTRSEMIGYAQPLESTKYYDFNGIGQDNREYYSKFQEKQMVSFFGRANYSLMDKYLFQATLRYDASSVLAEDNKWSSFPSVSAGWRLSEEDFLKNIFVISNLKLRYSWGIAGNSDIPPYSSQTKLANDISKQAIGDIVYSQYLPHRIGNTELTWETTTSHNVGLDIGLFENRLSGIIEYYNSKTTNLLFQVPLPLVNVYPEIWDNVASTKNQGIEIALNGIIVSKKDLTWSVDLNLSRNKGEVVELTEGAEEFPRTDDEGTDKIWAIGEPVDAFWIFENDGIYQIEDLQAELQYVSQQIATGDSIEKGRIPMMANSYEPGDIKLVDQNGDGEFNDDDKTIVDASPTVIFGLGSNLSLKTKAGTFGLRIYGIGRLGQTISYGFYDRIGNSRDKGNGSHVEAWTPQNTGSKFPRNSENGNSMSIIHLKSLKFVDGSFMKIKDITISYAIPKTWLNTVKIENLEVYATAKNMFTFSKLDNYDPERGGAFEFPLQKNIIFGINVNF
jgi:TonB-linked SusC/RagA family outer membrane protein